MRSRWNDAEAASLVAASPAMPADLMLRVYTSRLLGAERSLVLHGGGNTSVKTRLAGLDGTAQDVLFVKGSGSDLAGVGPDDFCAVRLDRVRSLARLDELDNATLAGAVAIELARPAPHKPSIETLLHAVLPWKFVEHTHADAVLAITNTSNGGAIAREVFGDLAPLVPFRASGFALAKACAQVYAEQAGPSTIGLILLHHGLFAFGNSARESYDNMLRLVTLAEDYLGQRGAWQLPDEPLPYPRVEPVAVARMRREIAHAAGFPLLLERQKSVLAQAFARRPDLAALCAEGPATPQHAVFIRRVPMLGVDVASYAGTYEALVAATYPGKRAGDLGIDPAPRVIIDQDMGVWVAAIDAPHLAIARRILQQDLEIKTRAAAHDRYAGLPAAQILEAEAHYGGFERRLLQARGDDHLLGEAVLVCGASGAPHEAALAHALLARGAALACAGCPAPGNALSIASGTSAEEALDTLVDRYGGLDVLVIVQGAEGWIGTCAPLLALAPRGGRVVWIGTHGADCERVRRTAAVAALPVVCVRTAHLRALSPAASRLLAQLCSPGHARPFTTLDLGVES